MAKRSRLEIIKDILELLRTKDSKFTPLLRRSNLSSEGFSKYYSELLEKEFLIEELDKKGNKLIKISEKGLRFLEKYDNIVSFIDNFDL